MDGVDPPCVAVIDLNEVPREVTERGYAVSVDFHGFAALVLLLQILVNLLLVIPALMDDTLPDNRFSMLYYYGGCLVTIFGSIAFVVILLACYGDCTLSLIRRSHISTPGCVVLLDRGFTVVLVGPQNIVEAIAESSFGVSNPITRRIRPVAHERLLWYETLEALCQGVPYIILTGLTLLLLSWLSPAQMAYIPMRYIMNTMLAMSSCAPLLHYMIGIQKLPPLEPIDIPSRLFCVFVFSGLMDPLYRAVAKEPFVLVTLWDFKDWLAAAPSMCLAIAYCASSGTYHIRTTKFLDSLGHPPVRTRRRAFDTSAAAATFQCLVVCRGIPRPIKNVDVLALLDTFVPDQRDIWKAWKERVADRIAHEIDISFAPTLPTFSDPKRQKDLKALLDQAQIGYGVFADSYD